MTPEDSNDCFLLAVAGAPFREIASAKELEETEVRRAIEDEVASRVQTDDFDSLEDALEYVRLGRIQRGMWTSASRGGVNEARQVLNVIERRNDLKKRNKRGRTLTRAIQDMLHANNAEVDQEEQDNE